MLGVKYELENYCYEISRDITTLHATGLIWQGKYQTLHLMQLAMNRAGNAGISIVF